MPEHTIESRRDKIFADFKRDLTASKWQRTPEAELLVQRIIKEIRNIYKIDSEKGLSLAIDLSGKHHQYQYEYQLQELVNELTKIIDLCISNDTCHSSS